MRLGVGDVESDGTRDLLFATTEKRVQILSVKTSGHTLTLDNYAANNVFDAVAGSVRTASFFDFDDIG